MKSIHTSSTGSRYRSVWISDVHLGFPGCSADYLLDFLHSTKCETLYLVGDIIDVMYMKKRLYWPQSHNDVVRAILDKAKQGTKVIFIPGNHDEMFREFDNTIMGNVHIRNEAVHVTADGRNFLVTHGDQFDVVIKYSKFLTVIGTQFYELLLRLNIIVNYVRSKFGMSYWSLAGYLKSKVKNAVKYISCYEEVVAFEASRQGVDGLICGHIHRAQITRLNGVLYCNTGDWVESCTALVERYDGALELLHWANEQQSLKLVEAAAA